MLIPCGLATGLPYSPLPSREGLIYYPLPWRERARVRGV